jgi:hypothetical protein
MQKRRLVIYQKNVKPIVITYSQDVTDPDCLTKIQDILRSKEVATIETEEDFLVLRPSEITAILVSKDTDKPTPPKKNDYTEELKITEDVSGVR